MLTSKISVFWNPWISAEVEVAYVSLRGETCCKKVFCFSVIEKSVPEETVCWKHLLFYICLIFWLYHILIKGMKRRMSISPCAGVQADRFDRIAKFFTNVNTLQPGFPASVALPSLPSTPITGSVSREFFFCRFFFLHQINSPGLSRHTPKQV
jgi:hypothetical protein